MTVVKIHKNRSVCAKSKQIGELIVFDMCMSVGIFCSLRCIEIRSVYFFVD